MKKFILKHKCGFNKGYVAGLRLGGWTYCVWLGYGMPIWWKPQFIGRGTANYGLGFGWLFLCFQIQLRKGSVK